MYICMTLLPLLGIFRVEFLGCLLLDGAIHDVGVLRFIFQLAARICKVLGLRFRYAFLPQAFREFAQEGRCLQPLAQDTIPPMPFSIALFCQVVFAFRSQVLFREFCR